MIESRNQLIDGALLAQFGKIGYSVPIFRELLTPDFRGERERFIVGDIHNPQLFYALPDATMLRDQIRQLNDMHLRLTDEAKVFPVELRETLIALYDEAIIESKRERELLCAGWNPSNEYNLEAFMHAGKALFGAPDPALFWTSLAGFASSADMTKIESDHSEAGQSLATLLNHARQLAPGVELPALPQETVTIYKQQLKLDELEQLLLQQNTDLVDLPAFFTTVLKMYGLSDWKVEVRPEAPNISAIKRTKTLIIGERQVQIDSKQALIKTIHEIGVHVQRSAVQSRVGLYNYGLPGYSLFEEGLACVLGAFPLWPTVPLSGKRLYSAIGLALGLDGQPRDFRAVYELLWRLEVALGVGDHQAKEMAFIRCQRIFRGANPNRAGNCHLKDTMYIRAVKDVLAYFRQNVVTPQEARAILRYRFTPTDAANQALIDYFVKI